MNHEELLSRTSQHRLRSGTCCEAGDVKSDAGLRAKLVDRSDSLHVRIARPTDKLEEAVAFYRDGVGLPVIYEFHDHEGYSGVMLGIPDDRIHLEFTHADGGSPCPAPSRDNLLVLYIPDQQAFRNAVHRLEEAGHQPVEPENPYWRNHGKTYEDPDGWRLVLYDGRAFEM